MTIHLLPVDASTDDARLAELLHAISTKPISADWLRFSDHAAPEGHIRWRVAAIGEGNTIVGYGETGRDPHMELGHFWLVLAVDQAYRNRGIGSMLYDDIARFAWEMGATHLTSDLLGNQHDAVRFARRRGFCVERVRAGHIRLRLNVASGVPSSPREAVKARCREMGFDPQIVNTYSAPARA